MCQENQDDFFDKLIMQDETWVHHYDPETKPQLEQWKNFKLPPTGDPEGLLQVCRLDAVNGYSVLAFWATNGDVLSPPLMTGMGSFIWRAEMRSGVFPHEDMGAFV